MIQNRRRFISTIAAGSIGIPLLSGIKPMILDPLILNFPIRLFSKPLDRYEFNFVCDCVSGAGIGGLDLTVRTGGKVEPEKVETLLPELVGQARRQKLEVDMIVTGIVSASDQYTERILKTASSSGVKYYRLGWVEYDNKKDVWETLQEYRTRFIKIEEINEKYKIHGGYQNHSGNLVGGPVWDLHELLRNLKPEFLGSQYDVRHAMVEGTDTWMIGMKLISHHIKTLAIKDFIWKTDVGKPQPVTVPLGDGMIDWDMYFKLVKELNIIAPITLHIEYPLLENDEEKLPLLRQQEIITRKLKQDADFINSYLKKYNLT
jgi:sugar phosphate isomerase/epimerase